MKETLLISIVTTIKHHIENLLNSLKLDAKLLIEIRIGNKGYANIISNWCISDCARHINIKKNYLRKLNKKGIIKSVQCQGKK